MSPQCHREVRDAAGKGRDSIRSPAVQGIRQPLRRHLSATFCHCHLTGLYSLVDTESSQGQKHARNTQEAPVPSTERYTKQALSNSLLGFPGGSGRKNPPANAGDAGSNPGSGRSPGGEHGNSKILAWRIPWTEKAGRLQSIGVAESDTTEATQHTHTHIHTSTCVCQVPWKKREQTRFLSSWSSS